MCWPFSPDFRAHRPAASTYLVVVCIAPHHACGKASILTQSEQQHHSLRCCCPVHCCLLPTSPPPPPPGGGNTPSNTTTTPTICVPAEEQQQVYLVLRLLASSLGARHHPRLLHLPWRGYNLPPLTRWTSAHNNKHPARKYGATRKEDAEER